MGPATRAGRTDWPGCGRRPGCGQRRAGARTGLPALLGLVVLSASAAAVPATASSAAPPPATAPEALGPPAPGDAKLAPRPAPPKMALSLARPKRPFSPQDGRPEEAGLSLAMPDGLLPGLPQVAAGAGLEERAASVVLDDSLRHVSISRQFRNGGPALTVTMVLPLPPLSPETLPDEAPDRGFPEQRVALLRDSALQTPAIAEHALFLGLDLTARLQADGMPLDFSSPRTTPALARLPAEARSFYESHQLAQWPADGGPARLTGWTVERVLSLAVPLDSKAETTLTARARIVPRTGYFKGAAPDPLLAGCLHGPARSRLEQRLSRDPGVAVPYARVTLPRRPLAGAGEAPPVNLTVTDVPADRVLLCGSVPADTRVLEEPEPDTGRVTRVALPGSPAGEAGDIRILLIDPPPRPTDSPPRPTGPTPGHEAGKRPLLNLGQ